MGYDLSIENPNHAFFITTRTLNSRLWFVNNRDLERMVLAHLAKFQQAYQVVIYGFVMMGNHYHLLAAFPLGNKAAFLRDFNSIFAKLTSSRVSAHPGGKLWARRARSQLVPNPEDVKNWFFYLSLNPVSSGLVDRISDYAPYNSFSDAVSGREREFKLVDWSDFNNRRRTNRKLTRADCTKIYRLKYTRLPGCEHMSADDYRMKLLGELEQRRTEIVAQRIVQGLGFAGKAKLRKIRPGAAPQSTKTSSRNSRRPLVLTLCRETRSICIAMYFSVLAAYREVSKRYRAGERDLSFPPGTYAPTFLCGLAAP